MWLEQRHLERRHKLKQIRANARARPLDKVRAGFICLGLALVLFASMGWLSGLSAIIGVVACVVIYGIVHQTQGRHGESNSTGEAGDDEGC